ncbi:unnamed protein product [Ilex paraguariensis]|uniref:Uncharacterized protein n=1 Tax=Ilex paraguariensis TaxID=185542 RepID=A0ABC8R6R0_9AQUA
MALKLTLLMYYMTKADSDDLDYVLNESSHDIDSDDPSWQYEDLEGNNDEIFNVNVPASVANGGTCDDQVCQPGQADDDQVRPPCGVERQSNTGSQPSNGGTTTRETESQPSNVGNAARKTRSQPSNGDIAAKGFASQPINGCAATMTSQPSNCGSSRASGVINVNSQCMKLPTICGKVVGKERASGA